MARAERSAGFLIYHRRPDSADGIRFLLLNYGRHWDFAKGHVDKGESDFDAAIRELQEETGIREILPVEGFQKEITYFFRSSRHGLIRKTVIFFLAEVMREEVILSEEHVGYEFLPYEKALQKTTFPAAKELLRSAHAYLSTTQPTQATT
jgi:bis(5'-nucleosidyl)-tetraphosphatase